MVGVPDHMAVPVRPGVALIAIELLWFYAPWCVVDHAGGVAWGLSW